jgi:hypothetical protein
MLKVTYGDTKGNWRNKEYVKYTLANGNIHMDRNENEHLVDFANNVVTVPG